MVIYKIYLANLLNIQNSEEHKKKFFSLDHLKIFTLQKKQKIIVIFLKEWLDNVKM